jgi:hypothetical protein
MSLHGSSPIRAGVDLLPVVCLLVPGSVIVAVLSSRLGRFRWAVWLGWSVTLVVYGLFTLLDERTEKAVFALALAVFGVGNGMVLTSVNVGTQAIANQTVAKKEDRAMAACMYVLMRSLGMPIGVAVRYKSARGLLHVRCISHADHRPSCPGLSFRMQWTRRCPMLACLPTSRVTPSATSSSSAAWPTLIPARRTAGILHDRFPRCLCRHDGRLGHGAAGRKFSMDTVHAPASQQNPGAGDDWACHGPECNARRVCARGARCDGHAVELTPPL